MSDPDRELEALPDDVRSLLDACRAGAPLPPGVRSRLASRLDRTLGLPPIDGGPGNAGDAGAGDGGAASGASTAASGSSIAAHGATAAGLFAGKAALVAAFAIGAVAGGATVAAVLPRAAGPAPSVEVTPRSEREAPREEPIVRVTPADEPEAQVADPPEPSAATKVRGARRATIDTSAPATAPPAPDTDLGAERALVERARTALFRRRAADALDALEEHERRFPGGRLSEERDALAVQSLRTLGRNDEARARATRFVADHPSSIFRPLVDPALE